ncbi:phage tail protein [Xenorhabdus griffiniae]|uniref:phage tail protein n=1 Tax=Xenorhabdus griffiniae TaxID=351672 RepID=UPI00235A2993|nr:phage tail protein [Xenorhabdus griffiniae]MDC9606110.1 phage tail protein [Xenorhabdus griffiniae]
MNIPNPSSVADLPKISLDTPFYGFGILEVQCVGEAIFQRYTTNRGQIAIRQSWDWGGNWEDWQIVYPDVSRDNIPVGSPIPWPLDTPPEGYVICDGNTFNTQRYPRLALIYPSGTLPDLRGEFIRGWDASRGIDKGRQILSWQEDALQNITGSIGMGKGIEMARASGVFKAVFHNETVAGHTGNTVAGNGDWLFDAARVVRTATETRPRNMAFLYIVRAA